MVRYDDALNRAKRLSVAQDYFLANKDPPVGLVQSDDVLVYLQWLVYHFHTTKMASAYLTVSINLLVNITHHCTCDAAMKFTIPYKLVR